MFGIANLLGPPGGPSKLSEAGVPLLYPPTWGWRTLVRDRVRFRVGGWGLGLGLGLGARVRGEGAVPLV